MLPSVLSGKGTSVIDDGVVDIIHCAVAEESIGDLLAREAVEGVVAVIDAAAVMLDDGIAAAGGGERVEVAGDDALRTGVLQEGDLLSQLKENAQNARQLDDDGDDDSTDCFWCS